MKKYFFTFAFAMLLVQNGFSTDMWSVSCKQNACKPGGTYAPFDAVQVPPETIHFKYDLTIDSTTKDDKRTSAIYCKITLPSDVPVKLLSYSGIQSTSEKDVNMISMKKNCCEFLLPTKKKGKATVEFELNFNNKHSGKAYSTIMEFSHYGNLFFNRETAVGGGVGAIIVGAVTGVITYALTKDSGKAAAAGAGGALAGGIAGVQVGKNLIPPATLQKILKKGDKHPMNDSYICYGIKVQ